MDGLEIVVPGHRPPPRPRPSKSTRELRADAAAEAARLGAYLEHRADRAQCHWCESGLYSVPATGCPGCGRRPRNGSVVPTALRSTDEPDWAYAEARRLIDQFGGFEPALKHVLDAARERGIVNGYPVHQRGLQPRRIEHSPHDGKILGVR